MHGFIAKNHPNQGLCVECRLQHEFPEILGASAALISVLRAPPRAGDAHDAGRVRRGVRPHGGHPGPPRHRGGVPLYQRIRDVLPHTLYFSRSTAWRSSAFLASCRDGMSTPAEDFRHRLTARSLQKSPSHPASSREWPPVAHPLGMA
jgi:hypothetical protein